MILNTEALEALPHSDIDGYRVYAVPVFDELTEHCWPYLVGWSSASGICDAVPGQVSLKDRFDNLADALEWFRAETSDTSNRSAFFWSVEDGFMLQAGVS